MCIRDSGTSDFSLSGVKKGTFTSSIAGRIELTFDAGVTNDEVNQVMRSLQYSNSSDTPPASVTLAWTFDDNNNGTQGIGGALQANGNTTVNITAVNDTPTTIPVALTAIDEDSGARLITQAQLLTNAIDIDGNALTATGLTINTGNGAITDNGDGTWNYTPAADDDTDVSFSYTITDGTDTVAGTATLDITPVNDAPTTTPVALAAIAEDSGVRLITQTELLANAADFEGDGLTVTGLTINTGGGVLIDNRDGTWNYTPAADDDTDVSFNYTITDGADNVAGTATLDISPIKDAPTIPSLENSPLQFTEGDAPLITTIGIDLADVDSPNLESATISISNNFVAGEDELTFDNAALNSLGINASFDDSTGILQLTGIASIENYQQAIRLISYVNDSENPSDLTREISYTISDGIDSTTRTKTLQVIPVNDAPTQLTLEGNLEIEENSAADNIGAVTFTDVDNNDTQEISVNDDRFEVVNGSLALRPGVTLDHESEPEVPLQITVSDDAGATATHDVILQVLDVNESPVLVEQTEDQISTEPFSFTLPESAFTDDDGDPLTLSATLTDGTQLPEWIQFEEGTFTITDDAPAESVEVLITATDPEGLSASTPITISIEPPIEEAVRSPQLTNPESIAPPPPVETTDDSETVVTSLAEETDEPSDSESSPGSSEEIFDASAINISESSEEQRQLTEVIQFQALSTTVTSEMLNKAGLDVELANDFNVLLTDSVNIEAQARQTNAANIATLQKLASEADKNQTLLANSQLISPEVLATSATLSSGFSVGYILWLLRGGTLLASVMASMPAWRAIDPLPVLQSLTDDDDDDDTETLQSMVEEQEPQESAGLADTETKTPGKAA